nr:hypothetical protein Itr_chr13CG11850 [Ipomoea trifida]
MPRYSKPLAETSEIRRSAFSYHSLPPSMIVSPGAPALTRMITDLGWKPPSMMVSPGSMCSDKAAMVWAEAFA